MARWRASLSSSVSRGEGGQAGDPMNCSEVKVRYLKVKAKYPKVMVTGQGQVPKDVIVLPSPDKVLHPLKFFPAGSRALFLPSPLALCPGPPGQAGGGDGSIEQFISETNLATALTTSLSDLICKEDRDIT